MARPLLRRDRRKIRRISSALNQILSNFKNLKNYKFNAPAAKSLKFISKKRAKRDRVDISKLSDKGSLKRAFGFSEPVVVLYVFAGSAYGPDSAQSA